VKVIAGQWNMTGDAQGAANAAVCNATCWGNATCVAWGLAKVTRTSAKSVPL
jgi:hypothetical protein